MNELTVCLLLSHGISSAGGLYCSLESLMGCEDIVMITHHSLHYFDVNYDLNLHFRYTSAERDRTSDPIETKEDHLGRRAESG